MRLVLGVDEGVLRHAGHALVDREGLAASHQVWTPGNCWVRALDRPVVDGQDVVFRGHLHEKVLHLLQLLGLFGGKVVDQAEVLAGVVKLPDVGLAAYGWV